jgi:aerobic carbon-monoxide dehydrogenase large subunit
VHCAGGDGRPMIVPPRRALARDRVRHVGDPVAFVVADTAQQARDAAERVAVAYRPLPAVVDVPSLSTRAWILRPFTCLPAS